MNRADQLREALSSVLKCDLPDETEFVIIDNASTDNTGDVVVDTLQNRNCYYEKMEQNLGCGGGRNYAFGKATGKYVYVLDDDAVIDDSDPNFFRKAIRLMDQNEKIISLTTQIYDTAWKANRLSGTGETVDGVPVCYMFCGGSHFLRRDFFDAAPYFPNKYGYEELIPSMKIWDSGRINALLLDQRIIHMPKVNKWDHKDPRNVELLIRECGLLYGMKKQIYPTAFRPLLFLAFQRRVKKYLSGIEGGKRKAVELAKQIGAQRVEKKKVGIGTVMFLYRKFGLTVF